MTEIKPARTRFLNYLHGSEQIGAEQVEWLEFLNYLHGSELVPDIL